MKALTLWPEWLPAICHMNKTVENRTWCPPDSLIGQRFALHAGKNIGGGSVRNGIYWLVTTAREAGWTIAYQPGHLANGVKHPPALHYRPTVITGANQQGKVVPIVTGAVVATAVLSAVTDDFDSPWAMKDQWHWQLADLEILPEPIPATGRQGLWNWTPPEVTT